MSIHPAFAQLIPADMLEDQATQLWKLGCTFETADPIAVQHNRIALMETYERLGKLLSGRGM